MNPIRFKSRGAGLIELMISVTLASLLFAAAATVFLQQNRHISRETAREIAVQECNSAFDKIGRLLRLAQAGDVEVEYGKGQSNDEPEIANDSIQITFAIPPNFPVWPNDVAPFDRNWIRIAWSNSGATNAYGITIANATSRAGLASAPAMAFAGDNANDHNARISNLDFDRQDLAQPNQGAGYVLRVSARSARADANYNNPGFGPNDPLRHFRTCTASGVVSPRN